MSVQASPTSPAASQRCHWYAYVIGVEPDQVPSDPVSVSPSCGVPETVGSVVFAGGVAAVVVVVVVVPPVDVVVVVPPVDVVVVAVPVVVVPVCVVVVVPVVVVVVVPVFVVVVVPVVVVVVVGILIEAVGNEVAVVDPFLFVATTSNTSERPSTDGVATYVFAVAPAMRTQSVASPSQACHW